MPYFVFKISPTVAKLVKPMEQLAEFDSYKEARAYARAQREQLDSSDPAGYKVIFADNALDAEEKLAEVREQPVMKEWEK